MNRTPPLCVFVAGILVAGCQGDSRRSGPLPASSAVGSTTSTAPAATTSSATTSSATTSGATAPANSATAATASGPASPIASPATTVTVFAGGFGLGNATAIGTFGVDEASSVAANLAAKLGVPLGINAPTAPNQLTTSRYYGSIPPAYYTPQDLVDVAAAPAGTARYAAIVAKHVREVLRRSAATHVNLTGGSFGGLITRYVIEHDLEGLASGGRIARWLTLEGAVAGSYIASRLTPQPTVLQLLGSLSGSSVTAADVIDLRTGTYDYLRQVFNTPDPQRSRSPFLGSIIVGHQVSTDDDLSSHFVTVLARKPNDGVLLVEDQFLTRIDARPQGPALAFTDTTHHSMTRTEGALALVANFLRSRRRVRIRLLDVLVRTVPEGILFGRGEVAFDTRVSSPEALREWGVNEPLTTSTELHGTAPMVRANPGDTVRVDATAFDWFVAPAEQELLIEFEANELDQNLWYSVTESLSRRREHMDTHTLRVPVTTTGTTTLVVDTPSFRLNVEVRVTTE